MSTTGGFMAGSIVAKLLLDKSGWNDSIKGIKKDSTDIERIGIKIGAGIRQVVKSLTGLAITGAVAIGAMVKKTADAGDAIHDMSVRTGVGAKELSAYKLAAEKSGSSLDGLATGLRRLSSAAFDANNGLLESKRSFAAIGVEVTDSSGKLRGLNEIMLDVADRFSTMEDGTLKAAIAQDLFGRSGASLIPMLNLGAEGLKKEAELAEKLGIVFDTKAAAAANRFKGAMTELGSAFEGIRNTIGNALIPVFTQLAEGVRDAMTYIRGRLDEFVASGQLKEWAVSTARAFIWTFKLMGKAVEGLMLLMPSLKAAIFSVAEGFYKTLGKIAEGIAMIPGVSEAASLGLRVVSEDLKAFAETYSKAADENIERASSIVAGFDALFQTLDIVSASFDKTTMGAMRMAAAFKVAGVSTEELNRNLEGLMGGMEAPGMVEFGIDMDLEGLAADTDLGLGILAEFVEQGAALSATATENARAMLDANKALYAQVFGDIINGFTSIMDGSKTMGEFFSSIVTTMIADMGKLVIASMFEAKKEIFLAQAKAVAHFIASIFKKVPFPLNIALAAGAFGLVSKLFSKLLKFKEGGVFKEPTIAEVGHGTEYLLPEQKIIDLIGDAMALPRFMGAPALAPTGGSSPVFHFHQNAPLIQTTGLSRRDVDEAAEYMFEAMDRQARRRGMKVK
jgi:hypothetical protein